MENNKQKNILIIGHPLVVGVNREMWSEVAKSSDYAIDVICPNMWKANLIKKLEYEYSTVDENFESIYPLNSYFQGNGSLNFFSPTKLWRVLQSKKYYRIILTQESWSLSLFFLSLVKLLTINSKTGIYLWVCQNIIKKKLKFLIPYERLICSDVVRVLGCCSETMDVIDWKRINTQKYYLPFSFDSKRFSLTPKSGPKVRIGYIGRLTQEKGIDFILKLSEEYRDYPNVEFVIAGAGPLEKQVRESRNVNFLGVLAHAEANRFYENMSIVLLPSKTREFWKEQFGRVIVEAAASGCLVVGSSSGAIPEVMSIVGFQDYIFKENEYPNFCEKVEKAISFIRNKGDVGVFSKKANEIYSHQSVANLLIGYLDNESSENGKINANGKINGFC